MPRAPADVRKPKRDARLRPLKPGKIDPFGWVVDEPVRKVEAQPIEHNIHGLETKPSFYEMVKAALLADKMQYLRGVSIHNILKHVAANWPVDLATYRRLTRAAVKRALENGKIETVGGVGVTYRLAPAERPSANRKKANQDEEEEEEKPRKPKTQRKTTAVDGEAKPKKAPKKRVADDSDEEEEPKKPAKKQKQVKKSPGYNVGDHAEQQSGEGKWVRRWMHKGLLEADISGIGAIGMS
jgi:hypothetical protein